MLPVGATSLEMCFELLKYRLLVLERISVSQRSEVSQARTLNHFRELSNLKHRVSAALKVTP